MSSHEIILGYTWLTPTLSGDATLMSLAVGGVWRSLAPSSTVAPFVIMQFQAGSDVTTFNGVRLMVAATYQAKIVGPASMTTTLAQGAAQIDALLGGKEGLRNIPLPDGYIYSCTRQSPLMNDELVDGEMYTNLGGLYRLEIGSQ